MSTKSLAIEMLQRKISYKFCLDWKIVLNSMKIDETFEIIKLFILKTDRNSQKSKKLNVLKQILTHRSPSDTKYKWNLFSIEVTHVCCIIFICFSYKYMCCYWHNCYDLISNNVVLTYKNNFFNEITASGVFFLSNMSKKYFQGLNGF